MTDVWLTAARDLPGLGVDPCPGDEPGVRRLAGQLRLLAADTDRLATRLLGPGEDWRGAAADAAGDSLHLVVVALRGLPESFEAAAAALDGWAAALGELQHRTGVLEGHAVTARHQVETAVTAAQAAAGDARLWALRQGADALHEEYRSTAARHADRLDAAGPRGNPLVGLFGTGWDAGTDTADSIVRRHAATIDTGASALSSASTLVGGAAAASAAVPGGQPLAAGLGVVSTVLGETSLAARVVLARHAQGPASDVWPEAVPAGLGRLLKLTRVDDEVADFAVQALQAPGVSTPSELPDGVAWTVPATAVVAASARPGGDPVTGGQRGAERSSPRHRAPRTAAVAVAPWELPYFAGTAVARASAPPPAGPQLRPLHPPAPSEPATTGPCPATAPTSAPRPTTGPDHGAADAPVAEPSPTPGPRPSR